MATAQVHHGGRLSHLYGSKRRDPAVKLKKVLQADNVLSKDGPFSKCRTRWSTTYSADYWVRKGLQAGVVNRDWRSGMKQILVTKCNVNMQSTVHTG